MNGMDWKPLKGGCPKEIPYRGGIRLENCAYRGDGRLTMKSKLIAIVATVLLLVALMIWANVADSPAESISGGSTGQPAGLEKDLSTEERIPTH